MTPGGTPAPKARIPEHNHAWGGPTLSDWCKPGCPFYDATHVDLDQITPGRVSPRECVRAARDALTKAYAAGSGPELWSFYLEAVDWLRRAAEQLVERGS